MPPRFITAAIVIFWLGMTGWLIYREVVPTMIADAAPPFHIDLTEEIEWTEKNGGKRGSFVRWNVDYNGKRVGKAYSRVVARPDRSYEFQSNFDFEERKFTVGPISVDKMQNMYRIAEDGKLAALSSDLESALGTVRVRGEVVEGSFEAKVLVDSPLPLIGKAEHKFDKVDFPQEGNVLNPMHLVNRLRVNGVGGLHDGKTWKIPLLDPFGGIVEKLVGKKMSIPVLIAVVTVDSLHWDKKDVVCYKIDYHEPGKEVTASTWVRKTDGLVLQQQSEHQGFKMVLQRMP
jgi:hypothetical protein